MSIKQEEYSFYYKVKNESARKRLGFKAGFFWCTAKKQSLALSRGELAMDAAGFDEADFARPVRVHFPVENDIPPEGVFDTKFCENREPGGQDGKTLTLITVAASGDTDTEEDSNNDECQDCEVSVATLPLPQRFLHIFTYAAADKKYLHHATRAQRRHITVLEMEQENNYIQNLLMVLRKSEQVEKQDNATLFRLTEAIKTVFSVTQSHQPWEFENFVTAWLNVEHPDRGLLVKEWVKGNRVSHITRTASGANAGGGNLTDRGEGFVHDQASLERDVAMGVLARAMDVDIYNPHPAHEKRIDEIIAENKPPFSVFRDKFIAMPGGRDYSRAIVVASVKEAPIGIEAIPARVTEYLNRVLTENDHASPDPLIVDIACGRTSQPMPVKGSANDDEEKPQPSELADEPATPEAVEQDTTEHHPDPQPLENEPPVSQTEAGYQKIRAELHEARKNIPPQNPVDVGKQLAAVRGEFIEGISDPDDPKWVRDAYSANASASNEGEKTENEDADDVNQNDDAVIQNTDSVNHSEPSADQIEPETPETEPEPQSRVPDDIQPGIYFDIPNEAYHAGPGVSKSQLDDIADTPALYLWRKNAPVDPEKTKTLDMGTAFHCRVLEPEEFDKRFIVAPEFNRRTNAGKEEEKAFLEKCASTGKTVITAEEGRKIELMYQSVIALPLGQWLVESAGYCESSIYWEDPETGILCRCRPDKIIPEYHWIMDVKTTADIHRFKTAYYDYRYHVQDTFYSDGYLAHFGEQPTFVFLVVSTTSECGRYPVEIFMMGEEAKLAGRQEYRRNLQTLAECLNNDEWPAIKTLSLPRWAKENANA
ncbi:TPA: PD-(D/E)XK nuclease-like domain-containing protein [Salmonella enterica subsp. enterica serovar Kottbus]